MQSNHDTLRARLQATDGPVVITAPTGWGKSTRVPCWLPGPVLVVEPRRVACRALATRVAELEGCALGGRVGYIVRADRRAGPNTEIVFATPGVVLRMLSDAGLGRFQTVVLDEFHERSLDLDLIVALLRQRGSPRTVVMSATIAGPRVAAGLGATHLHAAGRTWPVTCHHLPGLARPPDVRGLEDRVSAALARCADLPGDVLVFLPGKREISAVCARLGRRSDLEALPLHGGLSLREQGRVFRRGELRRIIAATNVAETSLTIPGVGVVIDAGLVRRTRYRGGRGTLTLLPIAADSAAQRAGRAGRTAPGTCFRLWSEDVRLAQTTPPEIHRESLVPLVLAAPACGSQPEDLPFLDAPPTHALATARDELTLLGALTSDRGLTERGRRMFSLPVDARLGRLLLAGERRGTLDMVIPLCAALSVPGRLFAGRPDDPDDDLRDAGCDARAMIRAVTEGLPRRHLLDARALADARRAAERFSRILGIAAIRGAAPIDGRALALTLLDAWPDAAHVARRRRREIAWSNGGTEHQLSPDSALDPARVEAVLALDSRSFSRRGRDQQLEITAAMPVRVPWLAAAGLGRPRMRDPTLRAGRIEVRVERVYARKVLTSSAQQPRGPLLREAVRDLFLAGRLLRGGGKKARDRHEARALAAGLRGAPIGPGLEEWLLARLTELGLEEPDEIELLEIDDICPAALPAGEQRALDRAFPRALSIGDARYHIRYDPPQRVAVLHQIGGARTRPPPNQFIPRLPGWTIRWERKNRVVTLR